MNIFCDAKIAQLKRANERIRATQDFIRANGMHMTEAANNNNAELAKVLGDESFQLAHELDVLHQHAEKIEDSLDLNCPGWKLTG